MAQPHLLRPLVANSHAARQKIEQPVVGGNPGIGADDTPCKRDRVSGGEDAEGIRQRQQNHRSFEEVDEVITEHVLSPSDLCDPYVAMWDLSLFGFFRALPSFSRSYRLFLPLAEAWAKRTVAHTPASDGNE